MKIACTICKDNELDYICPICLDSKIQDVSIKSLIYYSLDEIIYGLVQLSILTFIMAMAIINLPAFMQIITGCIIAICIRSIFKLIVKGISLNVSIETILKELTNDF